MLESICTLVVFLFASMAALCTCVVGLAIVSYRWNRELNHEMNHIVKVGMIEAWEETDETSWFQVEPLTLDDILSPARKIAWSVILEAALKREFGGPFAPLTVVPQCCFHGGAPWA